MNARKILAIAALGIFLGGVVAEDASARAGRSARSGGYSSMGARGARTFDNNGMQGIQRTRQWNNPAASARTNPLQQNKPSWFQRNPFMAGLAGALAGSALFSMLGGLFGGFGGMGGGGGGGFLTLLLLGGLAFMAYRMLKNRQQPSYAPGSQGAPSDPFGRQTFDQPSQFGAQAPTITDIGGYRQTKEQGLAAIALNSPGFKTEQTEDALSGVFFRVQEAWSSNDQAALRGLTTPEMFDYFREDLDTMAGRGERNVIKNIVMRSFELTEAWTEDREEYITVKIYARLVDYMERHGQVVEGSTSEPVEFKEAWTFNRTRGEDDWRLSAINQY
ncbi:MAG TPA: Tim44 domain-containing protein [Pantanalinema sp.]